MRLRLFSCLIAALLPLPALAQAVPANTVRCVDEALSIEDHEIAMVLMFVRFGDSGEERAAWLRGMTLAARMIDEARDRCRTAHHWSSIQASQAREYAFDSLMAEAMRQMIEAEGTHSAEPVTRYFADHAARLEEHLDPASEPGQAFTAYLVAQGWDADDEDELRLARRYLDALIDRQREVRAFEKRIRR
ncbi:MAG: hypothetical protein U1E37_08935 [Sphingomonadaceae bacterium]